MGWVKGYLTNSALTQGTIIDNYQQLWQIEKAFRISKTDLRIRPIYHRLPGCISTPSVISFESYKLYKELERQLKLKKSTLTVEKAIDLMKTTFKITIELPESKLKKEIFPNTAQKTTFNLQVINLIKTGIGILPVCLIYIGELVYFKNSNFRWDCR